MMHPCERISSALRTFNLMSSLSESQGKACISGGDTNLRDEELEQVGLPDTFGDLWEKLTWESTDPQKRLDQLYMCPKGSVLQPTTFDLVGESLLDNYGVYASDHFGVWVEFELREVVEEESSEHERKKKAKHDNEGAESGLSNNGKGNTVIDWINMLELCVILCSHA